MNTHRPGLDGLRAVAVLAVMAYHLDAPWMRGGFLGVDLFMALSGFLITSLLLAEHDRTGRVSLRGFWLRRVRRILPAVVFVLGAVALYAAVWATPVERAALRWDALASLMSWANWWFVIEGDGYWAAFGPTSPLTHFWSLAVEEQFYLVWPLVVAGLLLIGRGSRRLLSAIVVSGVAASAITMAVLFDPSAPSRAYLGTDTRVQTLLVGALGALTVRWWPDQVASLTRWSARLSVVAAVVMVGAFVWVGDREPWMYHGGFTAFAVVAVVVVLAAADSRALGRVFGLGLLVWIGRRSFGWYLWHWPLIVALTPERTDVDGAARVVLVLVLTVAFAELSFRYVEQPVRLGSLPPFVASPSVATVLTVSTVVALSGALVVTTRVPMPERPDLAGDQLVLTPPVDTLVPSTPATFVPPTMVPATVAPAVVGPGSLPGTPPIDVVGAATSAPVVAQQAVSTRDVARVLLQGDSVALFASLPAQEAFATSGLELTNLTFPGQSLANPAVLDAVASSRADLSIWQLSLWDDGDEDEVRAHHQQFVDVSLSVGADVVFVDRPPLREDLETPGRQIARRVVAELAAEHPGRVVVLDPSVVWGPTMVLDADRDGLPERFRDGVHVCPQGSARWTAWLLESLATRYAAVTPGDPTVWIDGAWLSSPHWAANPGQCDPVDP